MPRPRPNGNNNLPGKPPICPPLGGRLFRRGMRSPLPTSQFSLPRPYPINVRARRALRIYYLLSFIFYLLSIIYFAPQGHSRPRWCTDPQHPGKLQQKNSLTFSVRLYFGALCLGLSRGLTKPHWGFVVGRYARRPTRPVLVPDGAPVRNILGNRNKKTPLLPPLICTLHSFPRGLSRALKTPHRGVFAPRYAKRGARAVLVPDGAPIRNIPVNYNKKTALRFP